MGRLRSSSLQLAVVVLSLWVSGCGGGSKPGPPLFPGKVNLNPATNTSLVLGGVINFTASAQTASGTNLVVPITFASTNTSILNIAPNGVACAGHWDVAFTTCTPGGTGVVQVTASALGATSIPTYVFVHPPIDSITVTGIALNGVLVQEPCLSQSQTMTVEAHAFSQGTDITSSVGPFTWSANNLAVVNLTPLVNSAYNFPTNQATATAATPGMTQIFASASGLTSSSFQQPQYQNAQGTATSPLLDFFETCPIQSIALELGASGSQETGQTTFVTAKGTAQDATAVLTDVMGNSSLPNTTGGIVLSKVPLTWTASQPGVLATATTCQQSCSLSTPLPGSGTVTASCSPPTCNIGFPFVPPSLSSPAAVAACTNFFNAQYPQFQSCQQLIPAPVYAETAISGVITGATAPAVVVATSTDCSKEMPVNCSTSIYGLTTSKGTAGSANPIPSPPNSLLFDLAGDRAFLGSDFGALQLNPANFGTTSNPFSGLGTVTGKVLASSINGTLAVFSDTVHTPNQVYVVNLANPSALSATTLNISNAVAAAASPDGLKVFIFGNGGSSLYIYSPLQALQGPIALAGPANANTVAFSSNGAFAFVAEAAAGGGSANVTTFHTCDNQVSPPAIPLPFDPLFMKVLPGIHIEGSDSYGYKIPDGTHVFVLDETGFDVLTFAISPAQSGTICPQTLMFVQSGDPKHLVQRIELGQGTLRPLNFFASADGSQLYVAAAGFASILVYDFGAGAVTSGIELLGNATPITADMSADAGTIVVGASDGMLHELSTGLGGSDQVQLSFPNLPNYLNPFCTLAPATGPCTLNVVLAKP